MPNAARILAAIFSVGLVLAQEVVAPPAKTATARANAAPLYETAVKEFEQAKAADGADLREGALEGDDPAAWRFEGEAWRAEVERAAQQLAIFAQASRLLECDFGPGKDPSFQRIEEIQTSVWRLGLLTAAEGWQRLRAHQPAEALLHAVTLLGWSRHLDAQSSAPAVALGAHTEVMALALAHAALADPAASTVGGPERFAVELDKHTKARPGSRGAATAILAEARRRWATAFGAQSPDARPTAVHSLLQERGKAIGARMELVVAEWVKPLQVDGAPDLGVVRATVEAIRSEARKSAALEKRVAAMAPDAAEELLARTLATMMVPDLVPIAAAEVHVLEMLRLCREDLAALQARKKDDK